MATDISFRINEKAKRVKMDSGSLTQRREKNEKERENEACGKTYFMTRKRKSYREIPSAGKVHQVCRVPTSMTKELTMPLWSWNVLPELRRFTRICKDTVEGEPTSPRRRMGIVLIRVLLEDHSCPY